MKCSRTYTYMVVYLLWLYLLWLYIYGCIFMGVGVHLLLITIYKCILYIGLCIFTSNYIFMLLAVWLYMLGMNLFIHVIKNVNAYLYLSKINVEPALDCLSLFIKLCYI
jgi:hypothetical protein